MKAESEERNHHINEIRELKRIYDKKSEDESVNEICWTSSDSEECGISSNVLIRRNLFTENVNKNMYKRKHLVNISKIKSIERRKRKQDHKIFENKRLAVSFIDSPSIKFKEENSPSFIEKGSGSPILCTKQENKHAQNTMISIDSNSTHKDEIIDVNASSPILKSQHFQLINHRNRSHKNYINKQLKNHQSEGDPGNSQKSSQISIDSFTSPDLNSQENKSDTINIPSSAETTSNVSYDLHISASNSTPTKILNISSLNTERITFQYDNLKNRDHDSAVKKRRKKFSYGTLGYRFQKLIKRQESLISMWKHEHFMSKHREFEQPSSDDVLILKIIGIDERFNILMVDCESVVLENDSQMKSFTLILNQSCIKIKNIQIDQFIKLYKPYKIYEINKQNGNVQHIIINIIKFEILKD